MTHRIQIDGVLNNTMKAPLVRKTLPTPLKNVLPYRVVYLCHAVVKLGGEMFPSKVCLFCFGLLFYSVTPNSARAEEANLLYRLGCVEAQLLAHQNVLMKPVEIFLALPDSLSKMRDGGWREASELTLEIDPEFSGMPVTIHYKLVMETKEKMPETSNYIATRIMLNDETITATQSVQGGFYQGNSGSWAGMLPKTKKPIHIKLMYRSPAMPAGGKNLVLAGTQWRVAFLEAVVKRIPEWPEEFCGPLH